MTTRRLFTRCAGGLMALVVAYFALVHPAAFPPSLAEPTFQVDPAEGNVWLTSEIVFEVRGHISEKEALRDLRLTPPVQLGESEIAVDHPALLPWHDLMPWSKTRVRINPGHSQIFQSETSYTIAFGPMTANFETITLPRVVQFEAQNPPAPDLASVPTNSEIVLRFNEPLRWDDGLLQIDPPVAFTARSEITPEGDTIVRVVPAARWDNGTNYTLRVDAAVEDVHGHLGGEVFARTFITQPRPHVIAATPGGESVPVDSAVRIEFDRDVDRASVEASFRVEPAMPGAFSWESERSFLWRPQGLPNSARYKVSVAGLAPGGDAVVPYEWSFRTHDPPVFVQLLGNGYGPTVMQAIASGGTGSYSYLWNTGQTYHKILFKGVPGPQTVEVTVTSGDRTTTAAMQVYGPPEGSYTPLDCPEGWDMIDVSMCYRWEEPQGGSRRFITRIDLKDPGVQVRSRLSGDRLGDSRTVSQAAAAHGAVAAINGDFFYSAHGGHYPLGPVVSGGNVVSAPSSRQAVLAFNRERAVWAGPAGELRFGVQAGDGASIAVQGVNDIPGDNAMSVFNANWGGVLSLGAQGCVATFLNADGATRAPDQFGCGPLTGVGIPAGGYAIVARGAAADWLWAHAASGIAAGYTFPLGNLDFMVGGSHVLIQEGQPAPLPADARHPRSMIGVDANRFLYLVAVEGFGENIGGMTLRELQAYAASLGLTNAINLDGGGSTALAIRGWTVNRPSDGKERVVASVVAVDRAPVAPCAHPLVRCP